VSDTQVKAGELKMDRKIDILSRVMTPAPAKSHKPLQKGQKYLASTPDIDMNTSMDASSSSMDASFESAIDESLLEGIISPLSRGSARGRISDVNDPFFFQSGLKNQVAAQNEDEDDEEEEGSEEEEADVSHVRRWSGTSVDSQHSMGDTSLESPLRIKKPATKKAASKVVRRIQEDDAANTSISTIATDESGDVLGDMSVDQGSEGEVVKAIAGEEAAQGEDALTDEGQSEDGGSNEDSEDEEEDDEDDEEEEVSDDDDEDEIDEASQSESSFAESDVASESSVEPSPVRRMSTKKSRQTVSPNTATKRRQTATPSKTKGTPPKRAKAGLGGLKSPPPPLSERMRQDSVVEVGVDSEDEVEVVKPKAKKR